ncbi:hypothetical protein BLS_007858, partial [Venturia inaequalis]
MAMPSHAQSDSNALSPPLTPNPDPQSHDETPTTETNEHGNGKKRGLTAATLSPKRQRLEGDDQNLNPSQQQTNE